MGLAAVLIPLIPSLIQSVMSIIDAIKMDPATPADAQAHLAMIASQLDDMVKQVGAVKV